MKMITAIVNKDDSKAVNKHLIKAGYSVTRFATTGGFLLSGNITMIIVVEDEKVDDCIQLIAEYSRKRDEMMPSTAGYEYNTGAMSMTSPYPLNIEVGGATIIVTPVERFEKI